MIAQVIEELKQVVGLDDDLTVGKVGGGRYRVVEAGGGRMCYGLADEVRDIRRDLLFCGDCHYE